MEPSIEEVIRQVVQCSRQEVLPRLSGSHARGKADGSVVTDADLAGQRCMVDALNLRWPHIPVLGEELDGASQAAMLAGNGPIWCLDPLDGTSNFAAGLPYFAISLALFDDARAHLAVVYDPIRDECFSAEQGRGAWLNGERLRCGCDDAPSLENALALIDFKRLPTTLSRRLVELPPYRSQRSFGAGALDWCWLAASRVQVYLHGRQMPWDYGAGHLILSEAGGFSATLAGEGVFSRVLEPRSVVAATHIGLWEAWQAWLQQN